MFVLRFCKIPTSGVSTDMIPWFHLQHQPVISRYFTHKKGRALTSQRWPAGGLPAIMMTLWTSLGRPTPSSMPLVRRPETSWVSPREILGKVRDDSGCGSDVCFEGNPTLGFGGWKDSHCENGLKNKLVNRNYLP